jgi:hypothetical protein
LVNTAADVRIAALGPVENHALTAKTGEVSLVFEVAPEQLTVLQSLSEAERAGTVCEVLLQDTLVRLPVELIWPGQAVLSVQVSVTADRLSREVTLRCADLLPRSSNGETKDRDAKDNQKVFFVELSATGYLVCGKQRQKVILQEVSEHRALSFTAQQQNASATSQFRPRFTVYDADLAPIEPDLILVSYL